MKVKYIGETDNLELTKDKTYDLMAIEKGCYRVANDSGDDYLYPPKLFEIVEPKDFNISSLRNVEFPPEVTRYAEFRMKLADIAEDKERE